MQIKKVITVAQAERFCDAYDSIKPSFGKHKHPSEIQINSLRSAVGELTKASSVITRWCLFYKLHGRDLFIDYFARGIGPDYSDNDYLRILEYAVSTGTPIDRTWAIFMCSRRKLEKLSQRRKSADHWPIVPAARPPEGTVRLLDESSWNQRINSDVKTSDTEQSSAGVDNILQGDTIIAMGSTAKKEPGVASQPHKRIHGKSKKEVITLQRPAYKARRKDIAADKKQQEAILRAKDDVGKAIANMVQGSLPGISVKAAKGHDADELYACLKDMLKDPKDYDPQRRGRKPYFNPLSDGFLQLPKAVQQSSLDYYKLMEDAFADAKRMAQQVPANATQVERFQACEQFIKQNPTYPLKVVIVPFGFKYDNFKYYEKYRPKHISNEDPYLSSGAYIALMKCFYDSGCMFGKYRLRQVMWNLGYCYSIPTIAKLMKRCNLEAFVSKAKGMGKYSSFLGIVGTLSPNLLQRDFTADAPFQKIVSDVTELSLKGFKLYLSIFQDLFNNEIRAYSISASPSVPFVLAGLHKLVEVIPADAQCIIHTDQGHHYQRKQYRDVFEQYPNIIQSMSRKGNCYDNGACESWFGRFKDEAIKGKKFESVNDLVGAIESYIHYYNNERIQMGLQGKSPVEYARWMASKEEGLAA